MDIETLTPLLREAKDQHTRIEPRIGPHDWVDWYSAYITARLARMSKPGSVLVANKYVDAGERVA